MKKGGHGLWFYFSGEVFERCCVVLPSRSGGTISRKKLSVVRNQLPEGAGKREEASSRKGIYSSDADFTKYELPAPVCEDVAAEYGQIGAALDGATSVGEVLPWAP